MEARKDRILYVVDNSKFKIVRRWDTNEQARLRLVNEFYFKLGRSQEYYNKYMKLQYLWLVYQI